MQLNWLSDSHSLRRFVVIAGKILRPLGKRLT